MSEIVSAQYSAQVVKSERPSDWHVPYQFAGLLKRVLFLTIALLLVLSPIGAQKEIRRVVVLNEQSIAAPAVNSVDRDLYAELENGHHYPVEFYIESLDTALFPDETSQGKIREWFIQKYQLRRPDVIVAVGPTPIKFMAEDHDRFFPGIPVVFCCSTEQ